MERFIQFVIERRKLFIVIVLATVGFIYFLISQSKDGEKLLLPPYDQESGGGRDGDRYGKSRSP
ncbi:MAG: hypothetical protein IMW85_07185 [Thermicanus sp.]|nr:hypothetical protein [Thermicanus sp.]